MSKPLASNMAKGASKYLGRPYSEMDCQQYVENCLADIGINKDLKGSNAWFRQMTWAGTPESCVEKFGRVPIGAFLFIVADDGGEVERGYKDGLGNANHIGIYTGSGNAVHSSASRGCVAKSAFKEKTVKNGGWNMVGLWDALSYGAAVDRVLEQQEETTIEPRAEVKSMQMIVTSENGAGVNMRARPSTQGMYIARIPEGTVLDAEIVSSDWCKVNYNGRSGYAMSLFLRPVETGEYTVEDADTAVTVQADETVVIELSKAAAYRLLTSFMQALGLEGE